MKFENFNPKKVHDMYMQDTKYNIMLKDGKIIRSVIIVCIDDGPLSAPTYYFDNLDGDKFGLPSVQKIATDYLYEVIDVGDEWAISRNGQKVFPGNVFGTCSNYDIAYSNAYMLQLNNDTYTPDTIKRNDIVSVLVKNGESAIVTEVRKPTDGTDHGTVEIYFLDSKYFEHFMYTGWDKYLKVTEVY